MTRKTKVTQPGDKEVGTTFVESQQAELTEGAEMREEPPDDSESNLLVKAPYGAPAKVSKAVPCERNDDPVRLYLREISSVDLLSREGEIAIAKPVAGR